MTIELLGNLGELVGGVGVIVSVLYLAIQLRQNSKLLRMSNLQQTLDASRQRNFENAYLQFQGGALDIEVIDAISKKVAIAIGTKRGLEAWKKIRTQSPKAFVDWVESIEGGT